MAIPTPLNGHACDELDCYILSSVRDKKAKNRDFFYELSSLGGC